MSKLFSPLCEMNQTHKKTPPKNRGCFFVILKSVNILFCEEDSYTVPIIFGIRLFSVAFPID